MSKDLYRRWIAPVIYRIPPEIAHKMALAALKNDLVIIPKVKEYDSLKQTVFGKQLANPFGMAAGFDKDAEVLDPLLKLGFGFVEAGTVTPRPQKGNPAPRLFRLREDEALINRLGFNNSGMHVYVSNLASRRIVSGVVGANIGKNKETVQAAEDYLKLMPSVYPYADYITVNISSPNTEGLRNLQAREQLDALLAALVQEREQCKARHGRHVPLLLKIAPDGDDEMLEGIAEVVMARGVEGIIATNTTVARPPQLLSDYRSEIGGLSGRPLLAPSTEVLKKLRRLTQGKVMLVGVGGVDSAEAAYAKIRAGATLVQFYTAVIYQGFGLLPRMVEGLNQLLQRDGFKHISDAIGVDAG
jgi:dihydroorotate dehydrogenase